MASLDTTLLHSIPPEMRLTAGYVFPCYRVSAGRIAPRERVSFELDSAANN
jgi:hypothetical protein